MKKLLIILLALVALTGRAQTKTWDNVVIGYANAPIINVEKVTFAEDRTELAMRVTFLKGRQMGFTSDVYLQADSKQYAVKDATVLKLNEPYTVPTDTLKFSLIFEPVPQDTKQMDFILPAGLSILNIRNADDVPEGIVDTYWRNEDTGDWLIGFATNHVAYRNKVWDIASKSSNKDTYTFELAGGPVIKVGKLKKGKRSITIGNGKAVTCTPITTATLPDYPTKDLRKGFVDNGYINDSVTIIGWMKDMPEQAWKRGNDFEVSITNVFMNDQQKFYAKMDSLGRFTIRIPVVNTLMAYLDLGRSTADAILEPGKTYFFLNDFKTGQKLMMGDDARVQNELLAYPDKWNYARIEEQTDAMQFKAQMDSICHAFRAGLEAHIAQRPNLSQRYIDYIKGSYIAGQGESMMQARYHLQRQLPQEYMDFVTTELWQKVSQPYTLHRPFTTFLHDYVDHMAQKDFAVPAGRYTLYVSDALFSEILRKRRDEGKVAITDDELALLDRYADSYKTFLTTEFQKRFDAGATNIDDILSIDTVAVNQFNQQDWVLQRNAILEREDVAKLLQDEAPFFELYKIQRVFDMAGGDQTLRDIALTHYFYRLIDQTREPLAPASLAFFEQQVHLPAALDIVNTINDKYAALERSDLANASSLRPSTDLEGMSDGEKIFRKIIEPYKGRIIYLDIWGTWCGPCKQNLKESWKVKEALKDYDIVYLYLANRSSDESWRNVIKEYNLTGENCVHYNLPDDQQTAVEHYVGIDGYPTYKLIDKQGNIHDLHWLHHEDMKSFLETIDKMSK